MEVSYFINKKIIKYIGLPMYLDIISKRFGENYIWTELIKQSKIFRDSLKDKL